MWVGLFVSVTYLLFVGFDFGWFWFVLLVLFLLFVDGFG